MKRLIIIALCFIFSVSAEECEKSIVLIIDPAQENNLSDLLEAAKTNNDQEAVFDVEMTFAFDKGGKNHWLEGLDINPFGLTNGSYNPNYFENGKSFSYSYNDRPNKSSTISDNEAVAKYLQTVTVLVATKPHLDRDKFLHLSVGAGISAGTYELTKASGFTHQNAVITGLVTNDIIGVAKEIRDMQGHGTPEFADAFYTSLGGALSTIRFTIKF